MIANSICLLSFSHYDENTINKMINPIKSQILLNFDSLINFLADINVFKLPYFTKLKMKIKTRRETLAQIFGE